MYDSSFSVCIIISSLVIRPQTVEDKVFYHRKGSYTELLFCKANANRMQNIKLAWILCWDAALVLQSKCKSNAEYQACLNIMLRYSFGSAKLNKKMIQNKLSFTIFLFKWIIFLFRWKTSINFLTKCYSPMLWYLKTRRR